MEHENVTPATPAVETRTADELGAAEVNRWGVELGETDLAKTYIRDCVIAKTMPTKDGFFERIKAATPPTVRGPIADVETIARQNGAPQNVQLARTVIRHGTLKGFKGEGSTERAYRFGKWALGRALFDPNHKVLVDARSFCEANGLIRAMGEDVNELGGYLVPTEFSQDIIDLKEQYGIARKLFSVEPMASDTKLIPRRASGLTVYFPAEAGSITASDAGWDQISLVAKKAAVLARFSTEVNEDAIISFADKLATEIAYAFSEKEDQCGFNGDGLGTYGGMVGAREALKGVDGTIANIAGLQVASGNAYSEIALIDFEGVAARLPVFAENGAVWVVHKKFYWNVMVKLALAAGGNAATDIEDVRRQVYLGYPVVYSQVMPSTEANSQVCALLGNFAMGAILGDRRGTTIALSEHSRFANDQIEIRGTERFDVNVHGVGSTTAAGPIVGLITAAA